MKITNCAYAACLALRKIARGEGGKGGCGSLCGTRIDVALSLHAVA